MSVLTRSAHPNEPLSPHHISDFQLIKFMMAFYVFWNTVGCIEWWAGRQQVKSDWRVCWSLHMTWLYRTFLPSGVSNSLHQTDCVSYYIDRVLTVSEVEIDTNSREGVMVLSISTVLLCQWCSASGPLERGPTTSQAQHYNVLPARWSEWTWAHCQPITAQHEPGWTNQGGESARPARLWPASAHCCLMVWDDVCSDKTNTPVATLSPTQPAFSRQREAPGGRAGQDLSPSGELGETTFLLRERERESSVTATELMLV